jgi:NTP pyrophosphatase (non-canonical NTP hydrolase)
MHDTERYCLGLIAEECGEVIQLVGKALRFGLDEPGNILAPYYGATARELLHKELGDVMAAIMFATEQNMIDEERLLDSGEEKYIKLINPDSKDANGNRLAPALPDEV